MNPLRILEYYIHKQKDNEWKTSFVHQKKFCKLLNSPLKFMWIRSRADSGQALLIPGARRIPKSVVKVGSTTVHLIRDPRIRTIVQVPANEHIDSFLRRVGVNNFDHLPSPPAYARGGPATFPQQVCPFGTGSMPSTLSALFAKDAFVRDGFGVASLRTLMGFIEKNWDLVLGEYISRTFICLRPVEGENPDQRYYPAFVPREMSFRSLIRHKGAFKSTDIILVTVPK
ncbi:MAG TPA: hypothetical protein VJJ72_02650 [Candidatus Paceibacterota bacterium]